MFPRLTLAALSLLCAAVAAHTALRDSEPSLVERAYDAAADQARATEALALHRQALLSDTANAYRWADAAEAFSNTGQKDQARQCFRRALELSPHIPFISVRHANFAFLEGDQPAALQSSARVLNTVPDYDAILFSYFDRLIDDPRAVLAALGKEPRPLQSWLRHLIATNNTSAARLAWQSLSRAGAADEPAVAGYIDYLIRSRSYSEAQDAWTSWLGPKRAGDYPRENLVFNSRFQSEPSKAALDWHMASTPDLFDVTRDAQGAHIEFHGKQNVAFDQLSQTVILPRPGSYRLSARIQTDGVTTNEGIRLAIPELGLSTDPISGTTPPTTCQFAFTVSQPIAVRVAFQRRPSQKFDNKIEGRVLVSEVSLSHTP